jgi:hypothetical protein
MNVNGFETNFAVNMHFDGTYDIRKNYEKKIIRKHDELTEIDVDSSYSIQEELLIEDPNQFHHTDRLFVDCFQAQAVFIVRHIHQHQ